jgi:hypothetical protein
MFPQPVTFIVGAGASAEYNLPVGATLLERIGKDVANKYVVRRLFPERFDAYTEFGQKLAKFIEAGVPSIDDALTWFSSEPEIINLGKAFIVAEIINAENNSRLGNLEPTLSVINEPEIADTWIPHFLSMVMTGFKNEDAEKAFEKVSIINFNYDRTIEHFLYVALQYNFGLSESRAKNIVNRLNMFRPYGMIGYLPWQHESRGAVGFGVIPDNAGVLSASKNILTFSEGITGVVQQQIQLTLEKSRVTVFLGFGFHNQNMKILRVRNAEAWRRAYATVLGTLSENYTDMKHAIAQAVGCQHADRPVLLDWTAHKLLKDLRPALMAASAM